MGKVSAVQTVAAVELPTGPDVSGDSGILYKVDEDAAFSRCRCQCSLNANLYFKRIDPNLGCTAYTYGRQVLIGVFAFGAGTNTTHPGKIRSGSESCPYGCSSQRLA